MKISKQLPISISLIVSIPLLILSIGIYFKSTSDLINSEKRNMIQLVKERTDSFTMVVNLHKDEVRAQALSKDTQYILKKRLHDPSARFLQSEENLEMCKRMSTYANQQIITSAFIIDKNGLIITQNDEQGLGTNVGDREYFKSAMQGKTEISGPVNSRVTNVNTVFFSAPVYDESHQIIGVRVNGIKFDYFKEYMKTLKSGFTGHSYIIDDKGVSILNPNPDLLRINPKSKELDQYRSNVQNIKKEYKIQTTEYEFQKEKKFAVLNLIPDLGWTVVMEKNIDEINLPAKHALGGAIFLTFLITAMAVGLGIRISKGITVPITRLVKKMEIATKGDLSVRAEESGKDELRELSSSFNNMVQKLEDSTNEIMEYAYFDTLTGLKNKVSLLLDLEKELSLVKSEKRISGLLFIGLDDFKKVNDLEGHDVGDLLLVSVSRNLSAMVKNNMSVYRYSGDEFVVLIHNAKSNEQIEIFAEECLKDLSKPYITDYKYLFVTCSIGAKILSGEFLEAKTILQRADIALVNAKESGKNKVVFFNNQMSTSLSRHVTIENAIRRALDSEGFHLHYQPKVKFSENKIYGAEALLRLTDDELGTISPAEFIPVAERSNFIVQIGDFVTETAFRQASIWKNKGISNFSIAINISPKQFNQTDFLANIKKLIQEYNISPSLIELEITEMSIMEKLEEKIEILNTLREMGFKIAIDDFGTGYSSLSYLSKIPCDVLKIDKSFIDGVCTGTKNASIVEKIIQISHAMGLEVVAEGIETEEQVEMLQKLSCDIAQGYYFSKPLPVEKLEYLLAQPIYINTRAENYV